MSRLTWLPRSAWDAAPPARPIPGVVHTHVEVHHGASSNAVAEREPARVLREYQRYHLGKGWADIFYNLGLSPDGRLWEGRGVGKKSAGSALTVVLLGDYTNKEPTDPQKARILELADATGGRDRIDWHAHRAAGTRYASSCPGPACIDWLRRVKAAPAPAPTPPSASQEEPVDHVTRRIIVTTMVLAAVEHSDAYMAPAEVEHWVESIMRDPENMRPALLEALHEIRTPA